MAEGFGTYMFLYDAYLLAYLLLPMIVAAVWGVRALTAAVPVAVAILLVLPLLVFGLPSADPKERAMFFGVNYYVTGALLVIGTILTLLIARLSHFLQPEQKTKTENKHDHV